MSSDQTVSIQESKNRVSSRCADNTGGWQMVRSEEKRLSSLSILKFTILVRRVFDLSYDVQSLVSRRILVSSHRDIDYECLYWSGIWERCTVWC